MKDLDMRGRAIVDSARDADCPTSADRERIRRGLAVQIAAGTVAASTAAVAGTMSLASKVGLIVVTAALVGGGSVGATKIWKSQHDPRPKPPATSLHAPFAAGKVLPAETKATADRSAAPAPAATEDAEPRPNRGERARRRLPPLAGDGERPSVEDPLNAEVALLARAREELRLGRPARALDTLAEYDRRFGKGVLGEERRAIAAIATCQATPGPAARAQAEAFVRFAPSSPLAERVRATCITPGPPPER